MQESKFTALISLLDDTDREVLEHVSTQLKSLGPEWIPKLEAAWEASDNAVIQDRLEDLIADIQFENVKDSMQLWVNEGCQDLKKAALLVARVHFPDLDELKVNAQLDRIAQSVWINLSANLSPVEEVSIMNKVLFTDMGFKGNREPEAKPELSYINSVLDSRQGNSIGIGLVYLLVAEALDLQIYGVNLPYHFIMCYSRRILTDEELASQTAESEVVFYINPLLEGVPFSRAEITRYLDESKITSNSRYYAPCNNKAIIKTLIFNQMSCYVQQNDEPKANRLKELFQLLDN